MSKKKKDDFTGFEYFVLNFFGKIFDKWDDEDSEARLNKSRGIKLINVTWIVILVIAIVAIFFTFLNKSTNKCLFKAEEVYHQEEKMACEKLGQQQGCDLYFMDTPTWGDINARHDANVKACK